MNFSNGYTNVVFKLQETDGKQRIFIAEIAFGEKAFVHYEKGLPVSHVTLLGKPYYKLFNRYASCGEQLSFISSKTLQTEKGKQLIIEEASDELAVKTTFTLENDNGVLSVQAEVTNMQSEPLTLECVSPLILNGIMLDEVESNAESVSPLVDEKDVDPTAIFSSKKALPYHTRPRFFKAHNTWCTEAMFEEVDLDNEGMRGKEYTKRCGKIVVGSNGSQTTARYLPLGIFQKDDYGYLMFEILPEGSWSYEIEAGAGDEDDYEVFLCLSGKTLADNGWYKELRAGETYRSEQVRFIGASDLDGILEHTTKNRRNVKRPNNLRVHEQVIFNIFQQCCGSSPSEEKDAKWIPLVAETGSEYYVVDAGWFDNGSTHAVGIWDECEERYPSGLIKSVDKAREKGMKFGLWIEIQSVGIHCANKQLLPEHCFFHINGVRTICNGRYQLNYACQEVRDYADGIVKKIVDRYDVNYIKIDYNQTQLGTDNPNGSYTEGLAEHVRGYLQWFENIQNKYPNVIFETCASGGMWLDSTINRLTTVCSVSDQGTYYNYPPILANLPFIVLPEQEGIWCIPVGGWKEEECGTSDEQVVMNVINSLYGVMHLCSRIDRLTEKQKSLLAEGIAYYRTLGKIKSEYVPVLPTGFAKMNDEIVFTGGKTQEKLYLSAYNLSNEPKTAQVDLTKYGVKDVTLIYPKCAENHYELKNGTFSVVLSGMTARAFEFTIDKNLEA